MRQSRRSIIHDCHLGSMGFAGVMATVPYISKLYDKTSFLDVLRLPELSK